MSGESRDMILNAKCEAEMYRVLREYSPIFHHSPNQNSYLVDKTPFYLDNLVQVMDRTPGVPVVIAKKNDDIIIKAW